MVSCTRCWRRCRDGGWCGVVGDEGDKYPWRVVYASLVPASQLPLHHTCPDGYLLRLVLPGAVYECSQCWWWEYRDPRSLVLKEAGVEALADLHRRTGAPLLLLDGCEPLIHDWAIRVLEELEWRKAVRTCGLAPGRLERVLGLVEAIVLEYPLATSVLASGAPAETVRLLREKYDGVVEIHLYYDGSRRANTIAAELASKAADDWALHIIPLDESYIDHAYRLVERLREKHFNTYLYGDTSYTLTSTRCPKCGADIVVRDPYGVRVRLRDGRCPRCGTSIEWLRLCPRRPRALHRELAVL